MGPHKSSWRRALTAAVVTLLAGVGLIASPTAAQAAVACEVTYAKAWEGGTGFGGNITIRNLGDPLTNWTLTFAFPSGQTVSQGWNAEWSQSGANVTARSMSWNAAQPTGAQWSIGFNGTSTGTNTNPTGFSINGTACTGQNGGQQSLIVTPTSVNVPEGGTTTYAVRLAAQPSSNVTVTSTAASGGDADITVGGGASLTFTPSNWNTNQTVTVAAAQDGDSSNGTRTINVASSGLTTVPVTATEVDDDSTGGQQSLIVTPTSVSVPEGGTVTYTVRLAAQPSSNVTVTSAAASGGDADITVSSGASLTFTSSNWNTPQTVTVAAAQDSDTTNGTRTITVAASGLPSVSVTATEADDDNGGGPGPRVDNPYAGATGYVNPDWSAKAAAEPGGSRIANISTGVWMDRIAAIEGSSSAMGLREHLDEAVRQDAANGSAALTIQIVIYNLPNRDCSALASNGELLIAQNGLNRYKTEYIDPIADIMDDPQYRDLRIVTIIEIDSLPNLVTNLNLAKCQEAQTSGAYVEGVRYALNKLYAIPNVYNYVDAAHHGWLGWDSNFGPAAQLFASTARGTTAGVNSVHGFIVNTANYSALTEPYFTINTTVNGTSVRQSKWLDWNFYVDELTYAQAMRQRLIQEGFPSSIGFLIDTSRNGWGGSARPTGPSTSNNVDEFVNQSRVDRRLHAGNWCNQSGAGLGERPKASPATGIDAYVWIKPPGESDGASEEIPNNEGKGFDRMCDPTYEGNERNGFNKSGALPNAPLSGHWFSAQFQELMANAYPPLS
ncbi:cellulose 1,4-beta-cellobiosidase [Thermocatellispora tengchongensis]|uniref:Glucanase n=1 Tax=Thermocatellispora tengchongensis TaxID=1073253 RepID=A0A840P6F7_9ACTN|nr:glycoside hydrolase family 6 protein [Thermocatellispora tengchongensis]MBB5135258.1 cellulose 1,4-beta-cellobiosidase [Thermocatellispora tengchongensis]